MILRVFCTILLFAVIVLQFLRYVHINLDDKFILYKYAVNLANGNGLVYNLDTPVEGFSSFLFVVLMAFLFKVFNLVSSNLDTIIWMSITGRIVTLLFTFLTFYYLGLLLKLFFPRHPLLILLSLLCLACKVDFIFNSTNGLETGFFIFLFAAFCYHLVAYAFSGLRGKSQYAALLAYGSALLLTRVDGFIFLGAFAVPLLIAFLVTEKNKKNVIRLLASIALPLLAVQAGYILFRVAYFHDFFPNTYYAKVPGPDQDRILSMAYWDYPPHVVSYWQRFIISFFNYVLPVAWLPLLLGLLHTALFILSRAFRRNEALRIVFEYYIGKPQRSSFTLFHYVLIISSMCAICCLYTLVPGGDWMPGYRYIMHFLALPFVFLVAVTFRMILLFTGIKREDIVVSYFSVIFCICILLDNIFFGNDNFDRNSRLIYENGNDTILAWPEDQNFYAFKNIPLKRSCFMYADFLASLKQRLEPNDSVVIYETGCSSLYLGDRYKIVDMSGLNDAFIAHNKKEEGASSMGPTFAYYVCNDKKSKNDEYLLSQNPRFIIFDTFIFYANYVLCPGSPEEKARQSIRAVYGNNTSPLFLSKFVVYADQSCVPLTLLGNRYKLDVDFPNNQSRFFSVYERID